MHSSACSNRELWCAPIFIIDVIYSILTKEGTLLVLCVLQGYSNRVYGRRRISEILRLTLEILQSAGTKNIPPFHRTIVPMVHALVRVHFPTGITIPIKKRMQ
jgi:hypothetical protein